VLSINDIQRKELKERITEMLIKIGIKSKEIERWF